MRSMCIMNRETKQILVSLSVASAINYYFHSKLNDAKHFERTAGESEVYVSKMKHEEKGEAQANVTIKPKNDSVERETDVARTIVQENATATPVMVDDKASISDVIEPIVEVVEVIDDVEVVKTEMSEIGKATNTDLTVGETGDDQQPIVDIKPDVTENDKESTVDKSAQTGNAVLDAFYADLLNSSPSMKPKRQDVSNKELVKPIVEEVAKSPVDQVVENKTNRSEHKNKNKEIERGDVGPSPMMEDLRDSTVSLTFEDLVVDDGEKKDDDTRGHVELMKVTVPLRRVDSKNEEIKKEFEAILEFAKNW